jgi:hypothetical protein
MAALRFALVLAVGVVRGVVFFGAAILIGVARAGPRGPGVLRIRMFTSSHHSRW